MVLEALQVGLVVSISGIVAISLFTLYLLDQLGVKVRSFETRLKEWKSTEVQPKGQPSEPEVSLEVLGDIQRKVEQSQQSLGEQIEEIAAKTNSLGEELAGLVQTIRVLTDSLSENKGTTQSLRTEISSVRKKYDEIENMLTEMVRKSLRSRT